jgi:methyltransferase (TIGR00027 family)
MREQKPSATACMIAASLGVCARDPGLSELVNPLAAEASLRFMKAYGLPATLFTGVLRKTWFRALVYAVERSTIPGILLHYLLRKRYLEDITRDALRNGIRQVVVLGAGFDVLATALHETFPEVTFLEIDFPATQAVKREALASNHLGENLVFVPVDLMRLTLSQSLLRHPRYQPRAATLFIAEGVLMYLSQDDIAQLFRFIREESGPESLFAFTFMEPREDGQINFHHRSKIVDCWMRLRGEPFTWGIQRVKLPAYLDSVGFSQEELSSPELFRRRYFKGERPLAEGEYVCLAKRLSEPSR